MSEGYSRRDLLSGLAGFAGLGLLGSLSAVSRQAQAATGDRKFLFFFASGGWDATPLDPKFATDGFSPINGTDMDNGTFLGSIGNLTWSAGPDRLGMDTFFHRWGSYSHIIRGVNVHSAGHEAGMQWMMTGSSASSIADWPTLLASHGSIEYPMPHLVFSGPAYPGNFGASVVRGGGGSLLSLIDGSINGRVDQPAPVVSTPMDAMMDALVYERAARFAAAKTGFAQNRSNDLVANLERAMELEGRRFEAGLDQTGGSLLEQATMAIEVMRLGLSRCAMIQIPGGWDTHGGNQDVGRQLHEFFLDLDALMTLLATTPGTSAPRLLDEVTIVCTSELGRTPKFNGSMGRDHWPYTSMLVAGAGIRGNQISGSTDESFVANTSSLETGLPLTGGETIGSEHIGAALLELGKVSSNSFLPGIQPLRSILAASS